MADEIDLANTLIDNEISRALSKIRQNVADGAKGSKYCVECDDIIPPGRQKLGYKLCVPCAEASERKNQLFAG